MSYLWVWSKTEPATGDPTIQNTPRTKINIPKAEVRLSRPSSSTKTIDVNEIYAATNKPNSKAIATKE